MFHYYQMNRDRFMGRYRGRGNVETTFGMIKLKSGQSLRGKTPHRLCW